MSSRQCEHPTKSGARCRANSVNGSTRMTTRRPASRAKQQPRADEAGFEDRATRGGGSDSPANVIVQGQRRAQSGTPNTRVCASRRGRP